LADCTPASLGSFPQNRYIDTIVHEVMKWQHGVSRGRERGNLTSIRNMQNYIRLYVLDCIKLLINKTGLNSPVFVVGRSGNKSLDELVEADPNPTRKESSPRGLDPSVRPRRSLTTLS
ncbi:hypothetical protein ALC60_00681, partial [Trachymyrmex zeteki]